MLSGVEHAIFTEARAGTVVHQRRISASLRMDEKPGHLGGIKEERFHLGFSVFKHLQSTKRWRRHVGERKLLQVRSQDLLPPAPGQQGQDPGPAPVSNGDSSRSSGDNDVADSVGVPAGALKTPGGGVLYPRTLNLGSLTSTVNNDRPSLDNEGGSTGLLQGGGLTSKPDSTGSALSGRQSSQEAALDGSITLQRSSSLSASKQGGTFSGSKARSDSPSPTSTGREGHGDVVSTTTQLPTRSIPAQSRPSLQDSRSAASTDEEKRSQLQPASAQNLAGGSQYPRDGRIGQEGSGSARSSGGYQ
eukprot:645191-Hanusia_phi.AAC.1